MMYSVCLRVNDIKKTEMRFTPLVVRTLIGSLLALWALREKHKRLKKNPHTHDHNEKIRKNELIKHEIKGVKKTIKKC